MVSPSPQHQVWNKANKQAEKAVNRGLAGLQKWGGVPNVRSWKMDLAMVRGDSRRCCFLTKETADFQQCGFDAEFENWAAVPITAKLEGA